MHLNWNDIIYILQSVGMSLSVILLQIKWHFNNAHNII